MVVIPFSPWLITNRTALVSNFFAQISSAIAEAERRIPKSWNIVRKAARKNLNRARSLLNRFSKFASILSSAASAYDPTLVSAAAAGSLTAVEKITDGGRTEHTIEEMKSELSLALSQIATADPTFRILVLIDDLDRLDPDDAVEVLRLVKAVGDFPAITYLLAYDKAALAKAIEHSAKVDSGESYLEKIIQFSFKVPPLEPFQLRAWLRAELDTLFPDAIDHSSARASAVLDNWAGRLMATPRDVKRLLFAVRALWPKLAGRADLLDLVWLQMLAQKASGGTSDMYSWVVGYLQGLEAIAIGGTVTGRAESQEKLTQVLTSLGWRPYVHGKPGSSIDFHHLDEIMAGISSNHLSDTAGEWTHKIEVDVLQRFRDERRLSSPWHWRLYFALGEPSHAVTDDEWNALVVAAAKSVEDLSGALTKILEFRPSHRRNAADQILERASHAAGGGKLAFGGRWLVAIAEQARQMELRSGKDRMFGFTNMFDINFRSLSRRVFSAIKGPDRQEALVGIFEQKGTLCPGANLIRDQFHASSKTGSEKDGKFFLTGDEFSAAKKAQIDLYEHLTPEEFRALPGPYDVLYAWKDITGTSSGPSKLLNECMKSEADFLATLEALRYVSSSAQNGVPHIPEEFLANFVDVKDVKKRLESLAHKSTINSRQAGELLSLWWGPKD
jgi:hypothetical protein